jgi:glycosyltransferase involved in cell wall biosynthesis
MKEKITILIPVYNDTGSVNQLLKDISSVFSSTNGFDFAVLIINDGSTEKLTIQEKINFDIRVLNLQRNIGHQKAIAIGLAYIKDKNTCDKVLVMDGDGQDRRRKTANILSFT